MAPVMCLSWWSAQWPRAISRQLLNTANPIAAGVVLAGGISRRFGGRDKSLADLHGRRLIDHVVDRLRPQVRRLLISVEAPLTALEFPDLAQIPDRLPGHGGPLIGLVSVLHHMVETGPEDWLILAPCDAPFLPDDLACRLLDAARCAGRTCSLVSFENEWQPTFSAWHRALLPRLNEAVEQGAGGFKQFLRHEHPAVVDWRGAGPDSPQADPNSPNPFFNINTALDLDQARSRLKDELAGDT